MTVTAHMADAGEAGPRYDAAVLEDFAAALFVALGLAPDRARTVGEILVGGDLLGHTTHGLQLLPAYLDELQAGRMTAAGEPAVVADHGAALTWDGGFLPGPWLVRRAIEEAARRVERYKVATVVIARAHHIGCLAAYLPEATRRGLLMLLYSSDPSMATVAPHGAVASRFTPDPLAAGWPTDGDPVLVDISASTTTNGMTGRVHRAGGRLPGRWVVGPDGIASDDPAVLFGDPPGAILPLGGTELGHKGFGLALLVEALTSGLAGYGRRGAETRWTANVFLQLIDPAGFAGAEAFRAETGHLAEACRTAPVAPGAPAVRVPGDRAMARLRAQRAEGVVLHPEILPALLPWAERLAVAPPAPRG